MRGAQASELMLSTMTYALPERIRTLELLAEHWPSTAFPGHAGRG